MSLSKRLDEENEPILALTPAQLLALERIHQRYRNGYYEFESVS